jgi:hypothetical protein
MSDRLKSGTAINKNFAKGVSDSFPRLSIKGKVFSIRKDGEERPLLDPQSHRPIQALDVVLVNASELLARSYYIQGYEPGSVERPDCWSLNSIKPDPSVPEKVNPTCPDCPMNVFGSKVTDAGKAVKACQEYRRVAVVMPSHLQQGEEGKEPLVFMMKVPQGSLKNLKKYAENLERMGWEPAACVTSLSFDYQAAFPRLQFDFVDGLSDDEYQEVVELAEGSLVKSMLDAPDFDNAADNKQGPEVPKKPEPRQRQAGPVMETTEQQNTPPARPAKPTEVKSKVITLPDGQQFNPETGEYVEPPAPKVDMPEMDPDTMELPDGRFYNQKIKRYVTGPEIGAKEYVEHEVPERPKKPRGRPKGYSPKKAAAEQEETAPEGEATEASPQVQEPEAEDEAPVASNANGATPAPEDLEGILKSVLPTRK